ncbi:hypothetical protein pb186bvf_016811 [Paramecium bursaria]
MSLREVRDDVPDQQNISKLKSNPIQAYFNFVKFFLGIGIVLFKHYLLGILAVPFAAQTAGWLWSSVLNVFIFYTAYKSNRMLIEVADDLKFEGILYHQAARLSLGSNWAHFIDITIVFQQICICTAYLVFLTQSIGNFIIHLGYQSAYWVPFALSLIVTGPLSFIKRIHFFHQMSQIGFYFEVLGLILVMSDCIRLILNEEYSMDNVVNFENTFKFIGNSIFQYEVAQSVLPVRDSMIDRFKFQGVALASITTSFVLSLSTSFLSVITYQDNINPVVIFSIQSYRAQFTAIILQSTSLLFFYPLQLFPAIQIVEQFLSNKSYTPIEAEDENSLLDQAIFTSDIKQMSVRMSLMIVIYLIGYYIPTFINDLHIVGSILGSSIQYLFPILIHLIHFRGTLNRPIISYTYIIILAFIMLSIGFYEIIISLF